MRAAEVLHKIRSEVSIPWLMLTVLFIAVIWGNSLVPGSGSGSLSLAVTHWLQGCLETLGLPYAWLTNFIVRKAAHFTEYFVLGVFASQAFDPRHLAMRPTLCATALLCAAVPTIDETIQLFVAGRAGQVADVLLDCCGAAAGIALRAWIVRHARCSNE